jgi:hypothetical protein
VARYRHLKGPGPRGTATVALTLALLSSAATATPAAATTTASPAAAVSAPVATCAAPDARPTVWVFDERTDVPNRQVGNGCTINDRIDDERAWQSKGAFVSHLAKVVAELRKDRLVSRVEARTLLTAGSHAHVSRTGYTTIFDGTAESLSKWVQAPGGSFALQPDGTIRSVGGLGMLWYAAQEFGDFSVRLQFRDARTDGGFSNSGVFVRFPDPRTPLAQRPAGSCGTVGAARTSQAWVAIYCGQEIQIYDGPTGEPQKTGSIYNFQPLNLQQGRATPAGVWNDYEVRAQGQHYTIIRNGEVLTEFDNTPGKNSSRAGDPPTDLRQFASGFIGLQNHGNNDLIEFRNVRVRDLAEDADCPDHQGDHRA